MSKKTNYQATLSSGEVLTRSSNRAYSHAWQTTKDGVSHDKGFSSSKDLAEKAARASMNFSMQCQPKNSKVKFSHEVAEAKII